MDAGVAQHVSAKENRAPHLVEDLFGPCLGCRAMAALTKATVKINDPPPVAPVNKARIPAVAISSIGKVVR